jgi:hypothetical protein
MTETSNEKVRTWFQIALLIVTLVVSATIFVGSRPTRDEVNDMIDERTSQRFDRLEKQLDEMQRDIKDLLKRTDK